ncbi:MAG: class I SAM-dependent methyltransferase [Ignavibacteriales bacterium]|nr:class I SAM-dependent methyltransferase [Ignavibacteriales bacterium]
MNKYYNLKNIIHLDESYFDFDSQMNKKKDDNVCYKHSSGFYIFLTGNEIKKSDEYKYSDPYTVTQNFNSEFHQRRLRCTLELIQDFGGTEDIKLLDLGCGQGHITNKIKESFPKYEVNGLDYSVSAIEYAHRNFKGIDFICADAYSLPYVDKYFDIVICNNLWEHVPDPIRLLQGIDRILKLDGLLIISTPSRYRLSNLLRVLLGKEIKLISKFHITEYTVGQVNEQLKFCNYVVKKIYSPSIKEFSFILQLVKPFFRFILKILGSHHILESTVFYSAIKKSEV